jgi:hypothetical protein
VLGGLTEEAEAAQQATDDAAGVRVADRGAASASARTPATWPATRPAARRAFGGGLN